MKVRELQQRLSKLDPELDVLCYSEDTKLITGNMGFRLLDIENVDTTQGEHVRLDDGTPYLELGRGLASVTVVTLKVTSDF